MFRKFEMSLSKITKSGKKFRRNMSIGDPNYDFVSWKPSAVFFEVNVVMNLRNKICMVRKYL